ncbi:MAG: hypothetical protein U0531_19015 [Dehalococcoidia bacterium]
MSPPTLPTPSSALVTDLYELTMAEAYLRAGMNGRATFSLYIRRLPPVRGYLVAAGLEAALDYLETLRFTADDLAWLRAGGLFSADLLAFLADLRFTGDVRAVPEGRVVFAEEPLLEVTGPLIEAQVVETSLINALHLHTLLTSKAARVVDAAAGRPVMEFGLRPRPWYRGGHGRRPRRLVGGLRQRATSPPPPVTAPPAGTMAHSFVLSFPRGGGVPRLRPRLPGHGDAPDRQLRHGAGRPPAAVVAAELRAAGHALRAVRLDSGDYAVLSRAVRAVLDGAGFPEVRIVVQWRAGRARDRRPAGRGRADRRLRRRHTHGRL